MVWLKENVGNSDDNILVVVNLAARTSENICNNNNNNILVPRIMLVLAWLVAPVCSIPQSFIFQLKTHPLMQEYRFAGGSI